jgi:hypothetical protein
MPAVMRDSCGVHRHGESARLESRPPQAAANLWPLGGQTAGFIPRRGGRHAIKACPRSAARVEKPTWERPEDLSGTPSEVFIHVAAACKRQKSGEARDRALG